MAQAILDECEEVLVEAPFILGETRSATSASTPVSTARTFPTTTCCCSRNPTAEAEAIRDGIREHAGVEPASSLPTRRGGRFASASAASR